MAYFRPETLAESLRLLAQRPLTIVSGATSLYARQAKHNSWGETRLHDLLDISGVGELRGIADYGDQFRIGALTTWSDVGRARLPGYFDGLKAAADQMGSIQIRNRATLVGNVCDALPTSDAIVTLLCLDATVELTSQIGKRTLPLNKFLLDQELTAKRSDELVSALLVDKLSATTRGGFRKTGARRGFVVSTATAAAVVEVGNGGLLVDVRIAIGASSPVANRLHKLESALKGNRLGSFLLTQVSDPFLDGPYLADDIGADAAYRRAVSLEMTCRLLTELGTKTTS